MAWPPGRGALTDLEAGEGGLQRVPGVGSRPPPGAQGSGEGRWRDGEGTSLLPFLSSPLPSLPIAAFQEPGGAKGLFNFPPTKGLLGK